MGEESITLKVAEALQDEVGYGRGRLDTVTRNELGLSIGDIVEIHGRRRDPTVAIVWRARTEDEGKGIVRVDGLIRNNAKVNLGDKVEVKKAQVKPAQKVVLAPMMDQSGRVQFGPGIEEVILRGLNRRPLTKGDVVIVPGLTLMGGRLPFAVTVVQPKGIIQIQADTVIQVHEDPVKEEELTTTGVAYEDIGGLKEEIKKVREMIELPLKHPELFDALGIDPPKGVLLYGPPGTGKTLLAKAVANESSAHFISISGPEIMSKFYGESEARLRDIFKEAREKSPSIVFIDEIDSIAPKREEVTGEVERRVVSQLLSLMDGLEARGKVIVIAATNRPNAIDPALRRPGRFDREIEINVPSKRGRFEILQIHTRHMPQVDVDLEQLASKTHGFVGADLEYLAKEAAMKTLRRVLPELKLDDSKIEPEFLEKLRVTMNDFEIALKDVTPSAMREVYLESPDVKWNAIGGLESFKKELQEAVEWPLKYSEIYETIGYTMPKGVMIHGPSGTGKTLLAKAVATESEANFISVRGPELLSKWVGESERGVREVFRRARQAAPCGIFFDEIDALAPVRGVGGDSMVTERVVSQLLTELDGVRSLTGVVVLAATNRIDMVDTALLRPGRFDKLLFIPMPDRDARKRILDIHASGKPLAKGVDLGRIADQTDGFSGAAMASVVNTAVSVVLQNFISVYPSPEEAKKHVIEADVSMKHFDEAVRKVKSSRDGKPVEKAAVPYYR